MPLPMQLPPACSVRCGDSLFEALPRAVELFVWDLGRVALAVMGIGGSKIDPGPDVPVLEWYQTCVLDPDSLQERRGRPVGFKGIRHQELNRQLYIAAGRGDADEVRRLAERGADVNVRLFQLINHLDICNGRPSGHGVPLARYCDRWIDQCSDWNVARWGRAGDPEAMTYASRTPLHEAAQRGAAETVAALLELGASPFSKAFWTPAEEAVAYAGEFSRCAQMLAAAGGEKVVAPAAENMRVWVLPPGVF